MKKFESGRKNIPAQQTPHVATRREKIPMAARRKIFGDVSLKSNRQ